jgi:enoyl-CoA hydratase/carnithine racemase
MGTEPTVVVETRDDARVVHLGGDGNLVNEAFLAGVHTALDAIAADEDAAGLPVVTVGDSKYFCNGFDLEYLGSLHGDALIGFVNRSCELLARVLTFPAPTVAAVNGHAFGIGAMLALAHDQRVMRADRGWWCLPEVDLGLPFQPFMQALVTTRLPVATATEAMLSGRRYDGDAAIAAGIVQALAPADELVKAALMQIAGWAGKRSEVLGTIKRQLWTSVTQHLAV